MNKQITIPWKNNFTSPTIINIQDVKVLLSFINKKDWEFIDFISYEKKINDLKNFAFSRIQELTEAFSKEKSAGYLDRITLKIIDNLQIKFSNVHIRFEDFYMNPTYSLAITLQNLFVNNTDSNWQQIFIDRNSNKDLDVFKLLKISNFGLYLNINEKENISTLEDLGLIEEKLVELFPRDATHVFNVEYLIKPSKYFLSLHLIKVIFLFHNFRNF